MPRPDRPDAQQGSRLFKLLRRSLAGARGMRSKHGASLALDILAANGVDEIAITRGDGRRLHLSTRDKVIASEVIRLGSFGRANMEAFGRMLSSARLDPAALTFVNVGANIGTACLNAYDIGFRRFVAIEPEPENFRLLELNLGELTDADVRCLPVAVGDVPGHAALHRHRTNLGSHSLVGPARSGATEDTIRVAVEPLSSVVPSDRSFVLFIDVEGFEPQVIRSGTVAIEQACEAIALEVTPAKYAPADAADLQRRLAAIAPELTVLPSGTTHPTASLARLMAERPHGHFDVALVCSPRR
ncbi:MAG: FkbM family methyltransferase [Hyphomicrobiaceae bacterium]|nr:FkbM family methyltransferase [Hyphomicrobiaceae bacterium]